MKICVTSIGRDLNARVDPRFGRCQYFVFVDSDTLAFEAMPNEAIAAPGGAGIQAAQAVVNKGANMLISGNIGPNAFQVLSTAGVKIATGANGTVKEAVEMYKNGGLSETGTSTVAAHAGMGAGAGAGLGIGMGGGRGGGRGRGMGRGGGRGQGIARGGQGQGRMGGSGLGPGGECRCPNCGYTIPHQAGVSCYQQTCPKCGSKMTRP